MMIIRVKIKCEILALLRDKFNVNSTIFDCNKLSITDKCIINMIFQNRLAKVKQAGLYNKFIQEWSKSGSE